MRRLLKGFLTVVVCLWLRNANGRIKKKIKIFFGKRTKKKWHTKRDDVVCTAVYNDCVVRVHFSLDNHPFYFYRNGKTDAAYAPYVWGTCECAGSKIDAERGRAGDLWYDYQIWTQTVVEIFFDGVFFRFVAIRRCRGRGSSGRRSRAQSWLIVRTAPSPLERIKESVRVVRGLRVCRQTRDHERTSPITRVLCILLAKYV